MGMDKVILKSVLWTLASIAVLLVFMICSLCLVFPSTMSGLTYDLGMESASIHFAQRAYKGSDDIYYIARATEVAIETERDGKIISCGEQFIADDGFDGYCEKKGETYGQFIVGQVCVSKYEKGERDSAIQLAVNSLHGDFPRNNALVALLITARTNKDAETVDKIKSALVTLQVQEADEGYLQEIVALANRQ